MCCALLALTWSASHHLNRFQMYVTGFVQMQILPEWRTALYATWEVPGEMWSPRTKHFAELSQAERSEAAAEGGRRRRRPRASRGLQSQAGMRPNWKRNDCRRLNCLRSAGMGEAHIEFPTCREVCNSKSGVSWLTQECSQRPPDEP